MYSVVVYVVAAAAELYIYIGTTSCIYKIALCIDTRAGEEKKKGYQNGFTIKKETQSYLSIINVTPIAVQYCIPHYWLRLLKRLPNRVWK